MNDIWKKCNGIDYIKPIDIEGWRIVEAQNISSTRKLVDSTKEHEVLEDLIEKSKPPIGNEAEFQDLHYLLFTPFRYPPLKHGSRFGRIFERSLWYGSLDILTALAEKAFYHFFLLSGTTALYDDMIERILTAFNAHIKTHKGIDLTLPPFSKHRNLISSPIDYTHSQALGTIMRENKIEACSYHSARNKKGGINIAIFTPKAFKFKKPKENAFQNWKSLGNNRLIEFFRFGTNKNEKIVFDIEEFLIDGSLPTPQH